MTNEMAEGPNSCEAANLAKARPGQVLDGYLPRAPHPYALPAGAFYIVLMNLPNIRRCYVIRFGQFLSLGRFA